MNKSSNEKLFTELKRWLPYFKLATILYLIYWGVAAVYFVTAFISMLGDRGSGFSFD